MAPRTTPNQVFSGDGVNGGPSGKKENHPPRASSTSSNQPVFHLSGSMAHLDMKDDSPTPQEVPSTDPNVGLQTGPRLDEEKSHLSFSSTKAASLDGRSVTSGTTFAMDEKESLRPDDSASLKAAEEDESNSGPASGAPSSRIGSEAGGKAFRDQFNEISERMGPAAQRPLPLGRKMVPGLAEQGAHGSVPSLQPPMPVPSNMPRAETLPVNGIPFVYKCQEPDEKLIEAMQSPKDRLFLLQLEQRVISFIQDSQLVDSAKCF